MLTETERPTRVRVCVSVRGCACEQECERQGVCILLGCLSLSLLRRRLEPEGVCVWGGMGGERRRFQNRQETPSPFPPRRVLMPPL